MALGNEIHIDSKEIGNFHIGEPKTTIQLKKVNIHQVLIDACKQNDAKAQQELYQKYCVAMFSTCKRMLGNREDAQDVLQEAFIAAFRGIQNYNGRATFGAWLKRIVINKCINHLNRNKRFQFESISENVESGEPLEVIDDTVINTAAINDAISKLPDGCRSVFVMKAMEGYDHKEIATVLDVSIGTSKSQYNRAKTLLQKTLLNK